MKQCDFFSDVFITKIWPYFAEHYTKSEKSLDNTYNALRRMCEYLKKEPLQITSSDAELYKSYLIGLVEGRNTEKKLKISYVMASIAQIKSFYTYICEHRFALSGYLDITFSNPFQFVYVNHQTAHELSYPELPDMQDVDKLLSYFKEKNYMMYAAVVLACKMGLSLDEISKLKKSNVVKDTTNYYISFERRSYAEDPRYLLLTNDVAGIIFTAISYSSSPFLYVLSNKNKQYGVRSLQRHLSDACRELNVDGITFSSLRNAALCSMFQNGCPEEEIAKHAGLEGRWICRFENVDKNLISDSAKYVNFIIV